MRNIYDNSEFFAAYAEMGRSKDGLKAAGEWHQLQPFNIEHPTFTAGVNEDWIYDENGKPDM